MAIASAFHIIPSKIIIAPLNWGLGHATRCIPIIEYLLSEGSEVIIASDGNALDFLKKEYPSLKSYSLPAYDITYKQKKIEHSMLLQSPKIAKAILAEKKRAKEIAQAENPDMILSDNRLGFRVNGIRSIYITHQVKLISSSHLFSHLGTKIHQSYLAKFDACWIPDFEGSLLSGKMSDSPLKIPKHFLGCLSRMTKNNQVKNPLYDCIAILSGPEPQRTNLEEILIEMLSKRDQRSLLVRGIVNDTSQHKSIGNLQIKNFLLSQELQEAIEQSNTIICRSGYSSIMDLHMLDRKAILIPTPGQTEQEYLGQRAQDSGKHTCILQNDIENNLLKYL